MSTIAAGDVSNTETGALTVDEAADAFLARMEDASDDEGKKKPSEGTEDGDKTSESEPDENEQDSDASDENPEADDEGEDSDAEDGEGKDKDGKKYVDDDETYVKVKVGNDDLEVPVKDLKRLYGQEAALTRKSQEVAEQKKTVEAEATKYASALTVLMQRADEKARPYEQIDWISLAKNPDVSAEEIQALRVEAQRVMEEKKFLAAELGQFMHHVEQQQAAARVESAKACVKTLTDPGTDDKPNPLHIKGWDEKVYDECRAFAVSMGLDKDAVNGLTDPAAFKMIHMALQFSKGASKVQTVKVNKTAKKIVKTSSSPVANRQAPTTQAKQKAFGRLQKEGSVDAAADVFLTRMTKNSDE